MLGAKKRIGLFDSGLGGLSVLGTLLQEIKGSHFIYYADLDNGPYGNLNQSDVLHYSKLAFSFLLEKNADAILFACNTATSAAAKFLRQNHKVPIFGMEPAVKPATIENPGQPVAVFATELTLKEEKFKTLIESLGSHNSYLPVPCTGLAGMIDDGQWDLAWEFLNSRIQSVSEQTNVFVLGCTHYVFLKEKIKTYYPNSKVYDGNLGTAIHIKNSLNLNQTDENSLDIVLNSKNPKYLPIAEEIASKIADTYTISLNHEIGNKIHV